MRIAWLLILTVLAGPAAAQPDARSPDARSPEASSPEATVRFERAHDVEPHLPQSSVYEILEDRRGFLWFATREGLGRWDGYTMRTWKSDPFNPASLPGNLARQLVEDGHGDLWVRTEINDWTPSGAARLVGPEHERVVRYDTGGGVLFTGPDAEVWIAGSDSLYRYDRQRDRFVGAEARLGDAPARKGLTRRDGSVWISTVAPSLEQYGPGSRRRVLTPGPDWPDPPARTGTVLGTLFEDAAGTLWVGGSQLGRVRGGEIEPVLTLPVEIDVYGQGVGIGSIFDGDDGRLWLGTLNGVYRLDPDAPEAAERFSLQLPGDISTQNWVTALHRDRAGTLWAGTVWGLHRYMPYDEPFRLLSHNPSDPNSLGSGLVLSVHEDARGTLWAGTLGGGLNRIDPATSTVTRYRHDARDDASLSHDWIWSLASDERSLWIGTGDGVDRIDLDAPLGIERLRDAIPTELTVGPWGPSAAGLTVGPDGTFWFGYAGALFRHTPDRRFTHTLLPESVGIQATLPVPGGAWITTSRGLFRFDDATSTFRTYRHDPGDPTSLSHDATLSLLLDRDGTLWVGTNSGLNRYDPNTDGFHHYTATDGLPSDVVYALLEDDDGLIWLSTNRGLARLDPATGTVRAFTLADGIGNVEFNRNAATRGRDGTMYFGGDRGITAFDPAQIRDNPYRPPVVLTALHRSTRSGTRTVRYLGSEAVEVAPDEYTLTFEFAALSFTNPHHNEYAAMMEGFDADWVNLGASRRATYTNLPPGHYTFRVKAANEDGVWNETGTAIPLVVRPRFFQTSWFRLLAVLGAVAVVGALGWSASRRQYRRELARLQARQALEAERTRISRDMHDEVGASLTEIAILSELAQRDLLRTGGDGAPSTERLSRIADTSRAMLDAMGEIIWAINPQHDRLDRLAAYLREHAARTLEGVDLHVRLLFPTDVAPHVVSAEFRRNVFLVLKEALHNLVRHAGAHTATVRLELDGDTLVLTVQDDGCGMPEHDAPRPSGRGGNGLGNMAHRAGEIGGTLTLDAAPGRGTRLTLRAPLTHTTPAAH